MAREPRVTIEVRIVPPSTTAAIPSGSPPDPRRALVDSFRPRSDPPSSPAEPLPSLDPLGLLREGLRAPDDGAGLQPDAQGGANGLTGIAADVPADAQGGLVANGQGGLAANGLTGIAADVPAEAGMTSPVVLLAHDGPEYERVAGLSSLFPSLHVALLSPGRRNEWYSANPAYARALVHEVLPALPGRVVVGLGASLGGLALLHAETLYPGSFAGLFLQSGSFFTAELDPQEAGFPWYHRILDFVQSARPVAARVVLTCGRDEENLLNNRAMAARLGAPLLEVPGGHSMLTWRDALDPHLRRLLQEVNDDRRSVRRHADAAAGDG